MATKKRMIAIEKPNNGKKGTTSSSTKKKAVEIKKTTKKPATKGTVVATKKPIKLVKTIVTTSNETKIAISIKKANNLFFIDAGLVVLTILAI